jgi:putative aldouronate transport system substrate-binding protein
MNRIKKVAALITVAVILTSVMAGCSSTGKSTSSAVSIDTSKTINISYIGNVQIGATKADGISQKFLEQKFNVKFQPTFLDSTAYTQKLPILLSSGQIPDVMYLLDPKDVKAYASQGFLMELPYSTIKKYNPANYNFVTTKIPTLWSYSAYSGKNYGIPNLNIGGSNPKVGLWRQDWLTKVGITKVPETIDEFAAAFDKFVNNDPDGNGKKDTYALSGDMKSFSASFTEIYGAYGVLPFNWMKDSTGKVTLGMMLPGTKAALTTLADWYKKGYISPDFITDDSGGTIKQKFINGKIGYNNQGADYFAVNYDQTQTNSYAYLTRQVNPNAQLVTANLPKGPDGKSGTFSWGEGGHIITFGKQMANDPTKLQRILNMFEVECTDQSIYEQAAIGVKGVNWDYRVAGDKTSGIKMLPPYDDSKQMAAEGLRNPPAMSYFDPFPISFEAGLAYQPKVVADYRQKTFDPTKGMQDLFMKPDTLPSSGQYWSDLLAKEITAFTKIIRGDQPVSYLDTFINEWKAAGGDQLLKEAQDNQATIDATVKAAKAAK